MKAEYNPTNSVIARKVAGELLLVPVKANLGDLSVMYSANEIGTRVWELLNEKRSLQEMIAMLREEFEVEPALLEKDIRDFLEQLVSIGALQ